MQVQTTDVVLGVGVDVAEVARFERLLRRGGDRVWSHWYTEAEARECRGAAVPEREATVRFAVKEAAYKAVGADFSGPVRWRDVEVLGSAPRTRVSLHGEVADAVEGVGPVDLHVSTSHTAGRVVAMVVAAVGRPTAPLDARDGRTGQE